MEKNEISAGELKIQEYIDRIKRGEDKNEILKGLSPSFVNTIENGLNENIQNTLPEEVVFEDMKKEENIELGEGIQEEATLIKENIISNFIGEKTISFEKYKISIPNIDQVIENGGGPLEVIANGNVVNFKELILTIDGNDAEIMFIRKEDRTQNKGIGIDLYIEIGRKLKEKNITFHSSTAQFGPGRDIWMKLSALGFAEKIGSNFVFKERNLDFDYSLFNGAVKETVKHHFRDCLLAHEEIEDMYYRGRYTVSDKTVDTLAILGATITPMDLIKLTKGDREYIRKILNDFDKVFNLIYQEKKKQA